MLSNGANWVEHPELIAELTVRYAELVGRENVMIGNDCGFASQAATREIDPKVAWAKFAALAEGAGSRRSASGATDPAPGSGVGSQCA